MRALPALLALALFAGCIGASVQPASTTVPVDTLTGSVKTTLLHLTMKAKDGVALDLVANMSEDAKARGDKLPVIVDIGPYFSTQIMKYSAIDMRVADYFVPRGYAVARASLRGTGHSEGCFDLGGKTEQQDVHDIVEFLGEQPWSNGNVAVLGKSYDGTTPWEAAITEPSHLKTIVPISGISDMYRYTMYDGAVYPEEIAFEPYYYLFVGEDTSLPGPDGGDPSWTGDAETLQKALHPCQSTAFLDQTRADSASTLTGDHGDPFWVERDYELSWDKVKVPVFMVHGMQDWNVKPDHEVPLFNALQGPKAAWFGQWNHDYPDINHYKPEWSRHDWNETLLVWFDHWLKGVQNDWQKVAHVEAQDQAGAWTNYSAWPPADAVPIALHPTAKGALAAAGAAGEVVFQDQATDAAKPGLPAPPALPPREARFVTAPFAADATLLGRGSLDAHLSVDRPGGNLAIALYDVDASGAWTQLDHGARDLRHAKTRESSEPVTPLQPFNATVWLYPEEIVIPQGHRLGLVVSAELAPWYVASPIRGGTYHLQLGDGQTALHLLARADGAATVRAALG